MGVEVIKWTNYPLDGIANLEPSTTYYLNIEHDDEGITSRIDRWVRVLKL